MADDTATPSFSLPRLSRRRKAINVVTRQIVALGGAGVIAAIALIFFYLLWVVAPIFQPVSVTPLDTMDIATTPVLVSANDTFEVLSAVQPDGEVLFIDTSTNKVVGRESLNVAAVDAVIPVYPLTRHVCGSGRQHAHLLPNHASGSIQGRSTLDHSGPRAPVRRGPAASRRRRDRRGRLSRRRHAARRVRR